MSGRPFRTYDLIDSITKRALRQGDRLPQCDLQERYARDNARSPAVTAAIDRARYQGRLIYPRVDSGRQLPTSATRPMLDSYVPAERQRTPPRRGRDYSGDYRLIDSYVPRRNRSRFPVARGRDSSRGRRRSSMHRSVPALRRSQHDRASQQISSTSSQRSIKRSEPSKGVAAGLRYLVAETRREIELVQMRVIKRRSRSSTPHRRVPSGDRNPPTADHSVGERRQRSRSADKQVTRQPEFRYSRRGMLGTTPPLEEHMSRRGVSKEPPSTNATCKSAPAEQGALDALLTAVEPDSPEQENNAGLDDGQDFVRSSGAASSPKLAFEPSSPQKENEAAPDDGQDCQIQ